MTGFPYMSELKDRIIKRIVAQYPVTYEKLEELVLSKGYTEIQFMEAMELVHRDKRVTQTTHGDTIQYRPYIAPLVKEHFKSTVPYPPMDSTNNADHPAFADMDFSYLFLTPEELGKYKAESRGRTFIPKKKYERKRKQSTERSIELSPTQRNLLLAQQ